MAYPSQDIDALVNKSMDFGFSHATTRYNALAEQGAGTAQLVHDAMAQMYSLGVQIVNATALNQMPTGLSDKLLQLNASAGQPFNSPKAP